ncbi:zinc ribbon domain-containing protein [Limnoraphis robusta]|uniref:zinc ribbon domain-containing protein n=1 Tax=Limnoraphis robusta TaxID=1118279 RepID=UPI002B20279C|nr:zinc ribbon domain-containing protein [Limnoraphis robusta]MEA5496484.1 zinc ribbon domain-containing protein [Limnoraphis robusta BA-68 BA1]
MADNIFVEDINFNSWSQGIVRKRSLESDIGQFINEILPYICWKRNKVYLKVAQNGTSQDCPNCHEITGKKSLDQPLHDCQFCGHIENRDTASAKVIKYRGKIAVGQSVIQKACGDDLAGVKQLTLFDLVKSQ